MAEIDIEKLDELAGKVVANANAALAGLLAYIGDQTGVYRAMADGEPRSAEEIAVRVGPGAISIHVNSVVPIASSVQVTLRIS